MSSLALLLCTAFVLLLLALERRSSRGVSAGVWIPTLWMMMIASRPLVAWSQTRRLTYGGNESGSVLDRWGLTCLAVLAIIIFVHRRFDWWGCLRRHKWLIVLLAYMFVSTFWSDLTLVALRRWVRETVALVMALFLMSEANPRQAVASVLRRSAYVLIPFSVVLIKYYPLLGRAYSKWSGVEMWTGVTGQKNLLGRLCMISAFFLLWDLHRRLRERPRVGGGRDQTWADVSVLLIALYLIWGSNSSTSLATLMVGVAAFMGLRLFRKLGLMVPQTGLLALVLFLVGFAASAPFLGGSDVATFAKSLGRDNTLTGRTDIWADVLPARQEHPLLGYGLGSFWTDARRNYYAIGEAHNGYLDILLEQGEVGLAFYVVWLLSCARQLHRALPHDYEWASLAIGFLLMGLIYNVSESALNSFTEQMTAVPVLVLFVVSNERIPTANRRKSRTVSAPYAATDVNTGTDWEARETWPELTRNNTWSQRMRTGPEHLHPSAIGFIERPASAATPASRRIQFSERILPRDGRI